MANKIYNTNTLFCNSVMSYVRHFTNLVQHWKITTNLLFFMSTINSQPVLTAYLQLSCACKMTRKGGGGRRGTGAAWNIWKWLWNIVHQSNGIFLQAHFLLVFFTAFYFVGAQIYHIRSSTGYMRFESRAIERFFFLPFAVRYTGRIVQSKMYSDEMNRQWNI